MRKIWVSGAKGQLGRAINAQVDKLDYEMLDTDIDYLDITNLQDVLRFGEMSRPDVIINCSGLTDIKACEEDRAAAYRVNALGVRNLSIIAGKLNAKLVQISTDDVFDGRSGEPYTEFDLPNPQTVYGKSKLAGENYVKEFTDRHFIIRSTWVYGEGDNFVRSFLQRVKEGERIAVASDQFGSPTSAKELASFLLRLIPTSNYGTYHATNKGVCSRYDFAREILEITGKKADLSAVPTKQSDFSSVHPAYAVLDNFVLSLNPVYEFPDWKHSLREYLREERV